MVSQEIIRAFKESACGEISLVNSGIDRYIVEVPFVFDDGDHYVVILQQEGQKWILSDEGHTLMHLSYELREKEYEAGNRRKIIDEVLTLYQIENRDGELILPIPAGRYGDALFTFIQAITRVTDMTFLDRETVKSTFREDFNRIVLEKASEAGFKNVNFGYIHPIHDPKGIYPVDVRLNGVTSKQVLMFGVGNDEQCQSATVILLQWEKWEEQFHNINVFRDLTEINKQYLGRLTDVSGRQLQNLESAKERLRKDFSELLQQNP